MACLQYVPSHVRFNGSRYDRKDLLNVAGNLLGGIGEYQEDQFRVTSVSHKWLA